MKTKDAYHTVNEGKSGSQAKVIQATPPRLLGEPPMS